MNLILDFQQLKRTTGLQILNVHATNQKNVKDVLRTDIINFHLIMCSNFIILYDETNGFEYNIIKCRYPTKQKRLNIDFENFMWEFKPTSLSDVYDFLKDVDLQYQRDKKYALESLCQEFDNIREIKPENFEKMFGIKNNK